MTAWEEVADGVFRRRYQPHDVSVCVIRGTGGLLVCDTRSSHRQADEIRADLVLVSKTDLLPYLDFDLARCKADLATISPGATVLPVSAQAGDGVGEWYAWLRQRIPARAGG